MVKSLLPAVSYAYKTRNRPSLRPFGCHIYVDVGLLRRGSNRWGSWLCASRKGVTAWREPHAKKWQGRKQTQGFCVRGGGPSASARGSTQGTPFSLHRTGRWKGWWTQTNTGSEHLQDVQLLGPHDAYVTTNEVSVTPSTPYQQQCRQNQPPV